MEKRMELKDAGEDDEWLVPIQKAIQESCREARSAEADTEKKGDDETDIKLLLEEHDMFLEEMDPEPTPRPRFCRGRLVALPMYCWFWSFHLNKGYKIIDFITNVNMTEEFIFIS